MIKTRCSTVMYKNIAFARLKLMQPLLSVNVSLGVHLHRASCQASPWNLLPGVSRVFSQYQMVGGPWAWHYRGHHCYLWNWFYWIVYPERERRWREGWLCGCLMPSIFLCQRGFSAVSNPVRAPAAPRTASPKAQDTSSQNKPRPTQPSTQPAL